MKGRTMNRYALFFMLVGLQANVALPNRVRDFFNTTWKYFKPATAYAFTGANVQPNYVRNNLGEKPDSALDNLNLNSPELKATFKVIQDIRGLAARTALNAKTQHDICMELGKKAWTGYRTKQGLYLTVETYPRSLHTPWGQVDIFDGASYPRSLQTPWGQVVITDSGSYHDSHISDGSRIDMIFDEFRKNMKLKFVRNTCEKSSENRDKEVAQFYKEDFKTPIARKDLEKYRGTDTKIISSLCGCKSIYEIAKFGDIELPKAEPLEQKDFSDVERVRKNWKEFKVDYKNSSKQ